jgi:type I restriction enzyme R subunit
MTPEAKARERIDRLFAQTGWLVQDYGAHNIAAGPGVAVREFPLTTGFADYMLYAGAKVIGVAEAKQEGHTLTGVETQSGKYLDGLPKGLPSYRLPLPFSYESNGESTRFTNHLDPNPRSREVFAFHRPEELLRLVGLERQLRARLAKMPGLVTTGMWPAQIETVRNLEQSLGANRPRSLIHMATGSGKTYTAVSSIYRLIKFGGARRVLFLVDRTNLGKQTLKEFQQYRSPYTNYTFTEEYPVQHLRSNKLDKTAKVTITTIQRLYSILKGDPEFAEENEERSMHEAENPLVKEPLPVVYNETFPPEFFDFIVIDECHRSIYNLWRQVLEYFDSFLIGLTATPTGQTAGFFQGNIVQDYNQERAIADGVNVGFQVYRIETEVSTQGATLKKEPGLFVPRRDRRTLKKKASELAADLTYTGTQLDRDVVNHEQIRLILRTFRDRLPEIFPDRNEIPKTLIFAKTDLHAEDVVEAVRLVFDKDNDFCQKITSKADDPDAALKRFQNEYLPRIAVTVDMIATGTDVKPLECLLFLRDVKSTSYFDQMKGRGCRIASLDEMAKVNQQARPKTHFVIVDAVGVCESAKTTSKPLDRKPSVKFDKLLNFIGNGGADADSVSTLADRLARLGRHVSADQDDRIAAAAGGKSLGTLTGELLASIDADKVDEHAREKFNIPADTEPTVEQLDAVEAERMQTALKPFLDPALRKAIQGVWEEVNSLWQIFDEVSGDKLLRAGFDCTATDRAAALVTDFRKQCEERKDEIEALKVLYSRPHRAGLRFKQVKELATALKMNERQPFERQKLWAAFELAEPAKVKARGGKQLVDVIALVRHAIDPNADLVPVGLTVQERYDKWLKDKADAGVTFSAEQRQWLDAIRDHIASSLRVEPDDFADGDFYRMGGLGKAHAVFGDQLPVLMEELNQCLAA